MKVILFDIDGTLVDSNDAHAAAWVEALREAGIETTYPEIRRTIGMGGDHLLPEKFKLNPTGDVGKTTSRRRGEIFRERYLKDLKPFTHSGALLKELKGLGFKLVIATSASKKDAAFILEHCELKDLVDHVTHSEDAEHSKPDPDIIEAALVKVGAKPSEAIMIGDTPYDLEAAKRADVRSVGFKSGGWDESELRDAAAVYAGPAELLHRLRLNDAPLFFVPN